MSITLLERVSPGKMSEPVSQETKTNHGEEDNIQNRSFEEVLKSETRKKAEDTEITESQKTAPMDKSDKPEKTEKRQKNQKSTGPKREKTFFSLKTQLVGKTDKKIDEETEKGPEENSGENIKGKNEISLLHTDSPKEKNEKVSLSAAAVEAGTAKNEKKSAGERISGKSEGNVTFEKQSGKENIFAGNSKDSGGPEDNNTGKEKQKAEIHIVNLTGKKKGAENQSGLKVKISDTGQSDAKESGLFRETGNSGREETMFQDKVFIPDTSKEINLTKKDQTVLLKNLHEKVNGQIVKQADFIIKTEGSGEIRLLLKPESLGTVRIKIELQDNHIAGKIFVENNNIKDVFENNMDSLSRAFRESGFETSGLDVNVSGGRSEGEYLSEEKNTVAGNSIKLLEENVPQASEAAASEYLIDLVV